MAEAFLNHICGEEFAAYSAGLEPGKLNPIVVQVMQEIGIDISRNRTKAVSDMTGPDQRFDYVITVCDETNAERCPIFPGDTKRLHWGFPDPSALKGSDEDRLAGTRDIRDAIKSRIEQWCEEVCACARE